MFALKNKQLVRNTSFINGQWIKGKETFEVLNPFNNQLLCEVFDVSSDQVISAIESAKSAQKQWAKQSAAERATIMHRWYSLVIENKEDLAQILTLEQGKPLAEARGEIMYGASFINWFAEEGRRLYGDTIPSPSIDKRIITLKQPVGVVAAITPWNFPNAMIARKAAAALAAGCSFIVRPSNLVPLSALAMAYLAEKAGIPKGVLNIVVSKKASEIGQILTTHPDIAKFTFTGSTSVGKQLIAQCASTVKRVSMELGGNAPFIVFDDADIDEAVKGAIASKYRNAGQTCVCANRFLIQKGIYDVFCEKFIQAVKALKLGDGLDPNIEIGPMINQKAVLETTDLINQSVTQGAKVLLGGTRSDLGDNFFSPTILGDVNNEMPIARNEIFGPVAPLIQFETEDQAIEIANDCEYGLASYFYSRDIGRIYRIAEALEYGMVGINEGILSNEAAPFGGVKQSGNGREGSKYGLDDYTEIKYLCLGGIDR